MVADGDTPGDDGIHADEDIAANGNRTLGTQKLSPAVRMTLHHRPGIVVGQNSDAPGDGHMVSDGQQPGIRHIHMGMDRIKKPDILSHLHPFLPQKGRIPPGACLLPQHQKPQQFLDAIHRQPPLHRPHRIN